MNDTFFRRSLWPLLLASIFIALLPLAIVARTQNERAAPVPCDPTRSLLLVQQQIAEVKLLDDEVARISLLIRIAELLWPSQQVLARALFTEAFELASRNYSQKGEVIRREGAGLVSAVPDQRFVVIGAVARLDSAWARTLAQQALEEKQREAEETQKANLRAGDSGEKLIALAASLLPGQKQAAIEFARRSLRYRATMNGLPNFLNSLAALDQRAADQFYVEALNAYAQASAGELLYLAAYPFALNRAAGPDAVAVWYAVPPHFVNNPSLQRAFLESLFTRASQLAQTPPQTAGNSSDLPEPAQIYLALNKLEPLIARNHLALVNRAAEIRVLMGSLMTAEAGREVASMWRQQQTVDTKTFSSLAESIEQETNPERKDHLIVRAVQIGAETESFDLLEDLAQKISDLKVRDQLLSLFYFRRAQKATKEGSLDEAARLAKKVEALDQRAYLFFEIAEASVKQLKDSARARETLGEVAAMAQKAPNTAEKARTLLGITNLYVKYDPTRAFELMSEAIRTINRLNDQDFTRALVIQKIEGPKWSTYFSFNVNAFRLENTFRELGLNDFDLALDLARNLENKHLRATAIIALAAPCLEKPPQKEPPKRAKPKRTQRAS